jgi:hypothetical protein
LLMVLAFAGDSTMTSFMAPSAGVAAEGERLWLIPSQVTRLT